MYQRKQSLRSIPHFILLPDSTPTVMITVLTTQVVKVAKEHSRILPVEQRKVTMVQKPKLLIDLGDLLPSNKY